MKKACTEGTLVGYGWSFFLQKRVPQKPIFTYRFTSSKPDNHGFWKAGTSLKTVASYYEKQNKAFPSLPSYQNITLGAWIMTKSHGSSGDIGAPSDSKFDRIKYLSKNQTVENVCYKSFKIKDVHCILYVSFKEMDKNIWLKKIEVPTFKDWIETEAYQRVCFIGKNQDVMIRWEIVNQLDYTNRDIREKIMEKNFHVDPHRCSRFCLWFQADVCTSAGCRCKEPSKNFNSYVKLAEVNRFVPFIFPVLTLFVWNVVNFEIILKETNTHIIRRDYEKIKKFHKKYGGRTEIRFGTKVLFLDVCIQKKYIREYPIKHDKYHLGKYQPKRTFRTLADDLISKIKFKL